MTRSEGKTASAAVKEILLSNPDGLRDVIRAVMQEVLEAEMDEALMPAAASISLQTENLPQMAILPG